MLKINVNLPLKVLFRQVLDLALYLSFCTLAGTGLILAFKLPPGSRGGRGLTALGWSRHDWGDLHTWIAYLFISLIVCHLIINWSWLVKCAASGRSWRLFAGLAAGLAIVAAFCGLPVARGQ